MIDNDTDTDMDMDDAPEKHQLPRESFIEVALCNVMGVALGENFERQVYCDIGIVDMVSDETLVEVKRTLDRSSILRAIGQIQVYSLFFPGRRRMICGLSHPDAMAFGPVCNALEIELVAFEEWEIKTYMNCF
jgi:hypothetical protein